MPKLVKVKDWLIPWQWHADEPWLDEHDGSPTSYLAGFEDRDRAIAYGEERGWTADSILPYSTVTPKTSP